MSKITSKDITKTVAKRLRMKESEVEMVIGEFLTLAKEMIVERNSVILTGFMKVETRFSKKYKRKVIKATPSVTIRKEFNSRYTDEFIKSEE